LSSGGIVEPTLSFAATDRRDALAAIYVVSSALRRLVVEAFILL